ncbi:MAG: 50S ribosomal protein L29 [Anaerolineales bacterium]|nr:50S ribosomal protein L29 [Anaerolineales bacterium]
MKLTEIRALSDDEIISRLSDAKEELMRLRFQQATGELTDTSRLKYSRKTIARLHTVLRERELMEQE